VADHTSVSGLSQEEKQNLLGYVPTDPNMEENVDYWEPPEPAELYINSIHRNDEEVWDEVIQGDDDMIALEELIGEKIEEESCAHDEALAADYEESERLRREYQQGRS